MVWRNSSSIGCAVGHCNDKGDGAVEFPGRFYCCAYPCHTRESTLLTCSDYLFYGNNIAAGQFEEQVWAPVCSDPAISEVSAREDVKFDWTART
jgi:hypothetical protein